MEQIREQANKWIVGKYCIPDALPQADKIIQGLLQAWDDEKHLSDRLFERATRAESLAERLAKAALTSLAGIVCTPIEGYLEAPQCLSTDIGNLRKLEEAATKRADSAEAGWKEALATIEQMKDPNAEMLTTLKDIYRVTCMTSKASHKEQTEIFQRMRRIIGAAAE